MSNSVFNPDAYLNASFDQPSTRRPPLDARDDYTGVLGQIKVRQWSSNKDPMNPKSGIAYDIPVAIQVPPDQQERIGRQSVTLTHSIMVDLLPTGAIDQSPGANRGIRTLREAIDKNKPGDIFSPGRDIEGKLVRVSVKHELYQDDIQERIAGIARA